MNWLTKLIPSMGSTKPKSKVPDGLWSSCPSCESVLYAPELEKSLFVCPKCDHHLRIGARKRLEIFLDNGFFLLKEDTENSTPIGCLNYQYYENINEVMKEIEKKSNLIQCIVTNLKVKNAIPFGKSQQPTLWDYADGLSLIHI